MVENSNLSLEERVEQLRKAKIGESKGPKIQGVAHHLRERKHWAEHCSPKLISLGPIHHGHPNLQLGERYKQTWAAAYIHTTGQSPESLHARISIFIEDLTCLFDASLFANNDEFRNYQRQGFGSVEEKICWTMFVDGCALLHVLENPHIRFEDVPRDVLLLDNQLPFLLLKLLWRNADDGDLIRTMESFLHRHVWPVADADEARLGFDYSDPAHLLDL
ncbi:hypothetical protein Fmac_010335 [Flemingia macrophylla]|uniref:Uncharacterized protein n=1 Tax=Flemingia macrophylla TaxID=520843 RepID=A0ABD1MJA7_9FABA